MNCCPTIGVLVLSALSLTGCPAGAPGVPPPDSKPMPVVVAPTPPPPPTFAPMPCEDPYRDPIEQALDYVHERYPEQGCKVAEGTAGMVLRAMPSGMVYVLQAGPCLVMLTRNRVLIVSDGTGFRWEGRQVSRFVPQAECRGGGFRDSEIAESSVTSSSAGTTPPVAACTPEACKPTALEEATLTIAVGDYLGEHYGKYAWDFRSYYWSPDEMGQPPEGLHVFKRGNSQTEWTVSITRGDPPYRVVAEKKPHGFRWEGVVNWRPAWDNCRCYFEREVTELSVALGDP